MTVQPLNAPDGPAALGGYSQAVAVTGASRLLFISGQIPESLDSTLSNDFTGQCRQCWRNIDAQLRAAGMSFDNLVKVTTFLARREYGDQNSSIRRDVLGLRAPALTVIICGIYDPRWLLEIEAVAAA